MDLRRLDLNLLVALDALLEERSVTRAALRLGIGQPAMSSSLSRLRRHFGDELLARTGNAYYLTPLAAQLKRRTRLVLEGAERVLGAQPDFEPETTTREFSVVISDYGCAVFGSRLVQALEERAPLARLRLIPNSPEAVARAAETLLALDLLVVPHGFVTDLSHQDLHRDSWVVIAADDHPELQGTITVEQLSSLPWVATFHGPTASTPAARQLRTAGIEPRVQVVTESFLAVPALVAGSRRVALLQRRLADLLPPASRVQILTCPFDFGPLVEAMWWHPVNDRDPEHAFLRSVVLGAARTDTL